MKKQIVLPFYRKKAFIKAMAIINSHKKRHITYNSGKLYFEYTTVNILMFTDYYNAILLLGAKALNSETLEMLRLNNPIFEKWSYKNLPVGDLLTLHFKQCTINILANNKKV